MVPAPTRITSANLRSSENTRLSPADPRAPESPAWVAAPSSGGHEVEADKGRGAGRGSVEVEQLPVVGIGEVARVQPLHQASASDDSTGIAGAMPERPGCAGALTSPMLCFR